MLFALCSDAVRHILLPWQWLLVSLLSPAAFHSQLLKECVCLCVHRCVCAHICVGKEVWWQVLSHDYTYLERGYFCWFAKCSLLQILSKCTRICIKCAYDLISDYLSRLLVGSEWIGCSEVLLVLLGTGALHQWRGKDQMLGSGPPLEPRAALSQQWDRLVWSRSELPMEDWALFSVTCPHFLLSVLAPF